ncbi:MAG TPA: dienelactone hydrolase family protein [Nannocystis sp.]
MAFCVAALGGFDVKEAYGAEKSGTSRSDDDGEWKVRIEVKGAERGKSGKSGKSAEGGKSGKGEPRVVDVEVDDIVIPASRHGQRLKLPARLYRPKWSRPVEAGPAILMLHGSGGLHHMPKKGDDGPCSDTVKPQFRRWGKRLAELGYVVLMPASYSARGFCNTHEDADRMPRTFDERPEALLGRIYDVDAASRYLCDMDEVDCDRMGVFGFSHGATMAMLALHWQMDHAIERFRERSGHKLDIELPDLERGRPEFQVGVAYYPGCGTDGFLPLSTGEDASIYNKYFPTADLYVLHASEDPLVDFCSADYGTGQREKQAAQVAEYLGVDNTFHITVYENAGHGFDSGGEKGKPQPGDDEARDRALKVALKQIHRYLN